MTLSVSSSAKLALATLQRLVTRGNARIWLAVGAFYSFITLVMTYPVAFRLTTSLAGYEARDPFQFCWLIWWTRKSLIELGSGPANLTYLFHPFGAHHQPGESAGY